MSRFSLQHLSHDALRRELFQSTATEAAATADMLARLAEFDARRLFAPAGCSSMYEFCLRKLHLSENSAAKRIRVARAAREFPVLFEAVADGRLHVSAVFLLAPRLARENVGELVAAAAHRSCAQVELLLAERFPRPDVPALLQPVATSACTESPSLRTVAPSDTRAFEVPEEPVVPMRIDAPRAKVAPLAPARFAVQFTFGQEAHDQLRYVQALLGHAVPSGDLAEVFERALAALAEKLEKRKFAATSRPRKGAAGGGTNRRYIPAPVRRAVAVRDGCRCTFVNPEGERCESCTRLEFDHIIPEAMGGASATEDDFRLRCRAHNQYAAEQAFGAGFMERKRREARQRAAKKRAAAQAREAERARKEAHAQALAANAAARERAEEVIPWLRELGFRADEARRAAALCEAMPDAPLDVRVRHAIRSLAPRAAHHAALGASSPG